MNIYKYSPETDTVSDGECTMKVMREMPEWEGKDLIEDEDFSTELSNNNTGIAIPIKMKPKYKGWKEGIIKETLRSVGGTVHIKGSLVRYKRARQYDEDNFWTGKYEWHYMDLNNYNLIRTTEFLIAEK